MPDCLYATPALEDLYEKHKALSDAVRPVGDALWYRSRLEPTEFEYKGGRAYFTGWKFDPDWQSVGFGGQWVWTNYAFETKDTSRNFCVCLPSMKEAEFKRGATFDTGHERVYGDETPEELKKILDEGRAQLLRLVDRSVTAET